MKPEQDIKLRSKGIGGSDASKIFGNSKWGNPTNVYDEKLGLVIPEDISDKPYVEMGIILEPIVAGLFAKRLGKKIRMVSKTMYSKEWPVARSHIDAKIVGEKVGVEIKTTNAFNAKEWGKEMTDEIPIHYLYQIYHYLYVTEYEYFYCAVLIGGSDLRIYKIERDEERIKELIDAEKNFWENHVLKKIPPEPLSPEEALLQFPTAKKLKSIESTPMLEQLIASGKELEKRKATIEEALKTVKKDIMNHMKDAQIITDRQGNKIVSWVNGQRKGLDQKALKKEQPELWNEYPSVSEFRTFSLH